jgi:putative MATE family efflux protein
MWMRTAGRIIDKGYLTSGPIGRSLLVLAWPIMLGNLFQTFYNVIDTFWLGRLGKEAVAAPTLSWPLIFFMLSIGLGFTIAGTALIAQYTGAHRSEEANQAAGQVFAFMFLLSAAIAILGNVAARPLMVLMGAEANVVELAAAYLRIIYTGIPIVFVMFVFNSVLNGAGDTITPMKMMGASVALNLILDPLFIFGWGPFPALGVAGAAIATVASRGMIAAFEGYLLLSGRLGIHIRPHHLRLRWKTVRQIVIIGLPASIGQSGTALGFSLMTGILARFGTAVVSAFGIGNRVISIVTMPAMGMGRATATMVGQNLGAQKGDRAARSAWAGMSISTTFLVLAGILVYIFRSSLIRIFISDPQVVSLGARMFAITAIALSFMGILQVIIGTYQGAGHTVYSMFFSLFRLWGLRIPLVYLLGFTFDMRADGVWWAMALSNLGAAILSLGIFFSGNWKHRIIKEPPTKVEGAIKEPVSLQR